MIFLITFISSEIVVKFWLKNHLILEEIWIWTIFWIIMYVMVLVLDNIKQVLTKVSHAQEKNERIHYHMIRPFLLPHSAHCDIHNTRLNQKWNSIEEQVNQKTGRDAFEKLHYYFVVNERLFTSVQCLIHSHESQNTDQTSGFL